MKKQPHNPPGIVAPAGHFDRAIQLGPWLFISGTSALTNIGGSIRSRKPIEGLEAQTREALNIIEYVLEDVGGQLADLYEIRIILRDEGGLPIVNGVLAERIPVKGYIAHSYSGGMLHPMMEVELEAKAYLGGG